MDGTALPSITDFLTEISQINKEFSQNRPSRLRFSAFSHWLKLRNNSITEVMKQYVPQQNHKLPAIITEPTPMDVNALDECSDQLIKSTCMAEEARKLYFKHKFESIKSYSMNDDYIELKFLLKFSDDRFAYSRNYFINWVRLNIFIDVPNEESLWYEGKQDPDYSGNSGYYCKRFDIHLHSKEDTNFLFHSHKS